MARVILVEDNAMNCRLIEFVLKRDGHSILIYENAEDAVREAAKVSPDIILMDIQLPGMDGLEATRRLKENPETAAVPVVAITAHAMRGDKERILAAGCAGYIAKPVNTRELSANLEQYLAGSSADD